MPRFFGDCLRIRRCAVRVVAACILLLVAGAPRLLHAQLGGGMGGGGMGQGGGMGGGMGQGGGMGGGMGQGGGGLGGGGLGGGLNNAAGVVIDAQGVLRTHVVADPSLSRERLRASVEALPGDLRKAAPLRKVALSRLEAEVARHVAGGRGIPDELLKLAGLTRVQYVFVYPSAGDAAGEVVIAGPAEPWVHDAAGRCRGVESGSPTLLLDDLAAALRCFAPGHPQDRLVGCSIDPTREGLEAMQAYLRKTGRVDPQGGADAIAAGLKEALGTQRVSVQGVSPATHFALVMVEADYRMKLIGIGLERPPVKMTTWIDLASAGAVAANALQRWYFVPDYQCVRIAEDDLGIELVGRGVKLCGADEVVLPDGRRMGADKADKASKTFTDTFTRKYAEIAARNPVYAQLRNLIDLAVAAAYLQEHDGYGKSGWAAATLGDERGYAIERFTPPTEVDTAVAVVWRGRRLLTPIGGGVTVHPRMALDAPNLLMDEKGTVATARAAAAKLPADRWWWD